MAILVSTRGNQTIHPHATHYLADPQGLLHIYTGETHTATYKEWDHAYTGNWDDTGRNINVNTDNPNLNETAQAKQAAVPRTGFGS